MKPPTLPKPRPENPLYPTHHKPWDLEPHYSRHVGGMTEFDLHEKSDIAAQLAWRDQRIAELESQLQEAEMCCGHGAPEPHPDFESPVNWDRGKL